MAQLFGILGVSLANGKIIPFLGVEYGVSLEKHARQLEGKLEIGGLMSSIESFRMGLFRLDSEARQIMRLLGRIEDGVPPAGLKRRIAMVNERYMKIERGFLRKDGGLPGREWFKHMVSSSKIICRLMNC